MNDGYPPRVLASVLHFNDPAGAVAAVRALRAQTHPDLHIQVVDNASGPESIEEIRRAVPDIDLIALPRNRGYTGGHNVALRRGLEEGCDHVLLCNQDVALEPDAVRRLVRCAEADARVGVVGGVERSLATGLRRAGGRGYSLWRSVPHWRARPGSGAPACEPVAFVQGAVVLVTRAALDAGLLLNEDLFLYYDEMDLGFRLRRAGLRAVVAPDVEYAHDDEGNPLRPHAIYLHQRNRVHMVRLWGGWRHRLVYHLYTLLAELPAKLMLRAARRRWGAVRALVFGYLDGLRGRVGPGRSAELL